MNFPSSFAARDKKARYGIQADIKKHLHLSDVAFKHFWLPFLQTCGDFYATPLTHIFSALKCLFRYLF